MFLILFHVKASTLFDREGAHESRFQCSHQCKYARVSKSVVPGLTLPICLCTAGEPQSFNLKFKLAEDYPIDLYYLVDLSYSMKDDLENVKNLGTHLMLEMSKITTDFKIGEIENQPGCMRIGDVYISLNLFSILN